jgi:hypothetical protein
VIGIRKQIQEEIIEFKGEEWKQNLKNDIKQGRITGGQKVTKKQKTIQEREKWKEKI